MARGKTYYTISFGILSGNTLILFGMAAFLTFMFFSAKNRIHEIHHELFNASGPLSYDVDFENLSLVASTRITSVPRPESSKWKELPFMSKPQNFRVTHKIGFGSHTGTIELKVSDNGQGAEYLSSDIVTNFVASNNEINFSISPFKYDAPDFRLSFGDLSGTFSQSGHVKVHIKSLEMKMVNYLFRFADMSLDIPQDKKTITLLSSRIVLDDVSLSHSKIVFGGSDPFEIRLDSSFNSQPVEVNWNIQKTLIQDQNVKIGSGKMKFPVSLLDAYVEPKIERSLNAEEKQSQVSTSEKVRFLYSAAREVRKAEAKAIALRVISLAKNVQREGDFYQIRIDKQDAFKHMEEETQKRVERMGYIASWTALPPNQMFEEAFYGVIFGDENRALAVKELLEQKQTEHGDHPLYHAVKTRSAMRDALINVDEYNPVHLAKAAELVPAVVSKIPGHKFSILLKLELAKAKGDKALTYQLFEEFRNKEQEPQIRAMFEFMKYIHVDNPKALESLELARAINPKSLYVQNLVRNRIHVHQHMGNKEKMEEDFRILLGDKRLAPEDLLSYSNLLEEKKDYETSLKVVEKCIELDSLHKDCNDQRESVMTLIAYEKQKQNPDEAVQYLQNLLVDRPASIPANAGLGFLYKLRGDQDNSIKHYSIACALGGSFACIEAGDYLSHQGASEKASLLYDVSCDLHSGNGCMKAGLHAEKSGELDRSGIYYDRACNELHDNVACYHLARNLQKKRAPNRSIAPYLSKACKLYNSACKLASVYQNTNKQPDIPLEPK
jgi:tetratricopeptide (TPR) repeat protein